MTVDDFREMALGLPQATEGAHMGHPDFRVRGKIFATIWPDESWGMVKLTPEQQARFVQTEPAVFRPVKGGRGRKGATNVLLEEIRLARNLLLPLSLKTFPLHPFSFQGDAS